MGTTMNDYLKNVWTPLINIVTASNHLTGTHTGTDAGDVSDEDGLHVR
jgi:hypothetical protein